MVFAKPHYLLFCDASVSSRAQPDTDPSGGRWHFVLERIDASERLEAADGERATPRERLSLLAVVRGLEALEQPSQVTLVTTSRYVARGLRYGLSEWRETGYIWESFGARQPIRNADLWQRIDGAMRFHEVACRLLESSLAQQTASVTEEVANPLEAMMLDECVQPEDVSRPLVPAPHFRVRNSRQVDQPEESWSEAANEPEFQPELAAMVEHPVRRSASVRSVPRSHLGPRDASWWQTAAGLLGWRQLRPGGSKGWSKLTGTISG